MLTLRTKLALAVLHDISQNDFHLSASFNYPPIEMTNLLLQLEKKKLVYRLPNNPADSVCSYQLVCDYSNVNLLAVLEAIGEGIYFNRPSDEAFYSYYGVTARKLGVVNQMMRMYLAEVYIAELPFENTKACI